MYVRGFRELFAFEGCVLEDASTDGELMQVRLRRDRRLKEKCPDCGLPMNIHRRLIQPAWDLPIGTAWFVRILYEAVQVRCKRCKTFMTIHPPGIDERLRSTRRLMAFAHQLCRYMAVDHVIMVLPVPASTVRRWDKRMLEEQLPPPDLDRVRILLIDEKYLGKKHGYVTLVMNGETGELLYMGEGKKKTSIEEFFKGLKDEQKARIVAVALDRSGAYYNAVREWLPDAEMIFDKFHLIKNYHHLIDKVRRSEWRKAADEDKSVIKGQRYNLFRNREKLSPKQERDLKALLAMNENLSTVYVLRDALKQLWTYVRRGWAEKYFDKWTAWAEEAGIDLLTSFVKGLKKARVEILNYCSYPITTARLESLNATINRIVQRACGVSDLDYLFLKLRQETLGI